MKNHCSRTVGQRGLSALAAAVFSACLATPAVAQQDGAIGSLNLSVPVYATSGHAAQAPAAQSSDSAVLTFFRNTEVSGFVDTYYSYNFNTPTTRKAGVERLSKVAGAVVAGQENGNQGHSRVAARGEVACLRHSTHGDPGKW